nr:hypothetical protein [Burkholderia vietnamiensis]
MPADAPVQCAELRDGPSSEPAARAIPLLVFCAGAAKLPVGLTRGQPMLPLMIFMTAFMVAYHFMVGRLPGFGRGGARRAPRRTPGRPCDAGRALVDGRAVRRRRARRHRVGRAFGSADGAAARRRENRRVERFVRLGRRGQQ